jgi:hypothetical protein
MKLFIRSFLSFVLLAVFFNACSPNKQETLVGKWKVTELDFSGTKLSAEQIDVLYDFAKDGNYTRIEDGVTEEGTYVLSPDFKTIIFERKGQETSSEMAVEELQESKFVFSGEEFGLRRTYTLEKQ